MATLLSAIAVLASACGGGPSLSDYAEDIERLVHTMNGRLDEADRTEPPHPTIEWVRASWAERAEARWDFVEAASEMEPPDSAADLHIATIDLVTELARAETALAELAASVGTMEEVGALADGPEAAAYDAVNARAIEFCQAAQAHFDATESAEAFTDTPFIPTEMQEVIIVAFRCTAEERGLDP
jgi:hypothetical protein